MAASFPDGRRGHRLVLRVEPAFTWPATPPF